MEPKKMTARSRIALKPLAFLLALVLAIGTSGMLSGCSASERATDSASASASQTASTEVADETAAPSASPDSSNETASTSEAADSTTDKPPAEVVDALPEYSGQSYVEVNGNVPYFKHERSLPVSYESYAPLDMLGRCGTAQATVGEETMPDGSRGDISDVKPSGWEQERYDFVDGGVIYNRSHLIGWQLTGENANEDNLITGTRHMNVDVMEPLESAVADYVHRTGNHVRYRVTPVFKGEDLVARGVLMEARSLEDGGSGIRFCVYAFNTQPGVDIDYATGSNWANGQSTSTDAIDGNIAKGSGVADAPAIPPSATAQGESTPSPAQDYTVNENTRKFHLPSCASVKKIKPENRQDVHCPREDLIAEGYDPCGICNP